MYPLDGLNPARNVSLKIVLQIARQMHQMSRLFEAEPDGARILNEMGIKTDFPSLLRKALDDYGEIVESSIKKANNEGQPEKAVYYIKARLAAAAQRSLKTEGMNALRRAAVTADRDMVETYAKFAGFDPEDMDPRTYLAMSEFMYSEFVGHQENRQQTLDGTMGTAPTRIQSEEKPGGVFSIVNDIYAGKTEEQALRDVRQRAIEQALIDASQYKRFADGDDPTMEDFYNNLADRNIQPEETDYRVKALQREDHRRRLVAQIGRERQSLKDSVLSKEERKNVQNRIGNLTRELDMIEAWDKAFAKNNENFNPNLAGRVQVFGNNLEPNEGSKDVSFSSQQDGFHGAFPEYARKSLREVIGIPALRKFALTKSRFGLNIAKSLNENPPAINTDDEVLSVPSLWTNKSPAVGSLRDLVQGPGLTDVTPTERALQLRVRLMRAAKATPQGSNLRRMVDNEQWDEAFVYVARKEVKERAHTRSQVLFSNLNLQNVSNKEERIAQILFKLKTEEEKEFQTLFSGFASASERREMSILEMDRQNNLAKVASGETWTELILNTSSLEGSQAERTNLLSYAYSQPDHVTRVIYEGTSGTLLEGDVAGGRGDRAETALNALMAFHTDSFHIIVSSALWSRLLEGQFYENINMPSSVRNDDGTVLTWREAIDQGKMTTQSAILEFTKNIDFTSEGGRNSIVSIVKRMNRRAGDSGFKDINLIDEWGIKIDIIDDTETVPRTEQEAELLERLSFGTLSIDSKNAESGENLRLLDDPTKTFINGFGDAVRTNKIKGDIRISLTRDQKLTGLLYSRNQDIVRDGQILRLFNLNQLSSREAESTRVSAYIPDILMDRTNLQQMPPGSLDMHLRYLAQLDTKAIQMLMGDKKVRIMTDSTQSGMDDDGNIVSGTVAEYLNFEKYSTGDGMTQMDNMIEADMAHTYGLRFDTKLNELNPKDSDTKVALTMFHYGIPNKWAYLASGILSNNADMRTRMVSRESLMYDDLPESLKTKLLSISTIASGFTKQVNNKQKDNIAVWRSSNPALSVEALAEIDSKSDLYFYLRGQVGHTFRFIDLLALTEAMFNDSDSLRQERLRNRIPGAKEELKQTPPERIPKPKASQGMEAVNVVESITETDEVLDRVVFAIVTKPVHTDGTLDLSVVEDIYKPLAQGPLAGLITGDPLVDFVDAAVVRNPDESVTLDKPKAREIFADTMRELGMTDEEIRNMPEVKDPEGWMSDTEKTVVLDIETRTEDFTDIVAVGFLKRGDSAEESIRFGLEDEEGRKSFISSDQARDILVELEDLQNQGYKIVTFNGNNFDIAAIRNAALRGVSESSQEALDLNRLAARVSMRSIDMMQSVRSQHPTSRFSKLENLAKAAQKHLEPDQRKLKSEETKGSDIARLWEEANGGNTESRSAMFKYIMEDLESTMATFDGLVFRFKSGQSTEIEITGGNKQTLDPVEPVSSFFASLKFRNMQSTESIDDVFRELQGPAIENAISVMKVRSLQKLTDRSDIGLNKEKVQLALQRLRTEAQEANLQSEVSSETEPESRERLVNAIINAAGGRSPVELAFRGSLIKTSTGDQKFTSFNDLVMYLVNQAKKTGTIDTKSQEEFTRLVTLLTESSEVRDILTDLEIVFSGSSKASYTIIPEQQGRTYGRIELPTPGDEVSFERTLRSLTHELIHHAVRSHLLRMTGEEYAYFKDLVFSFMFRSSGIKNLAEAGLDDIRSVKDVFSRLGRDAGVSSDISDLVVKTFNDLRSRGASHGELEYFLVQEFFAYGMTYVAGFKDKIGSRRTIELSEVMSEFLKGFRIPEGFQEGDPTPGSMAEGITNFLFSNRKTVFDNSKPSDKVFDITLYDQTNGARMDGNPYESQIKTLSQRLVKIEELKESLNLTDEQKILLRQEEASVRSAIYRMNNTTERLSNDLDIEAVTAGALDKDNNVDFNKIFDDVMKREIATRRLAELGARTEISQGTSRIQQVLDSLGISTTGMNIVRGHHMHIVRALGTMLNPDTWFTDARYGAERGMLTLQAISVMERGETENLTRAFLVANQSLNKLGFSSAEITEAIRLYTSDKSVGSKMDPQLVEGIKPVAEMFLRYIQSVAQRAKDEGLINEKAYTALMNGNLPLRLKRSALESVEQIQRIQYAIADNYSKKLRTNAPNTPISVIAVIGNNLIPSPRVFSKDILETRYKDISERVVKWAEGDSAPDLDWSTDVVSRVQGAFAKFRNQLKNGQSTRADLEKLGLTKLYDESLDQKLNTALITEYHQELGLDYAVEANITAAQYHAGRMMHHLRNNSYKFDDPFLDFAEVAADPILLPFLEFNPLQIVQGLRRGLSHEAYERFMIRKTLGIRGLNYTDLIDYAEKVTETGRLVPTVEDGKVVNKIITKDDMRQINKQAFKVLRMHRDTARGVFPKPESAGTMLDTLEKVSAFTTNVFSYPTWTMASIIAEGGFSVLKKMGRALEGPVGEVHEAFASLNSVDQAKALELLGMQIYSMSAQMDNARYGGQDLESLDLVIDMLEAETDGEMTPEIKERLNGAAAKAGTKVMTLSKMGFNATQRHLRATEVPNAIRKLGADVSRFPDFIDALEKFIKDNGRNPDKGERQRLMRDSGLGNSAADMNRLAKYMDSGLMDKEVVTALTGMLADQSAEMFSFDKAVSKYVTFGDPARRDLNLRALMAFRDYLYRMSTDTNLEMNVGDSQVLLSSHVVGRFFQRLTQYATLAFRVFRNLVFAAPASLVMTYLATWYVLENLYSSLARIVRGSPWQNELKRWTDFNEKPVETVATYVSAGLALPQFSGFSAPLISSLFNVTLNSLGFDTPRRLMVPGTSAGIGLETGLRAVSGMRSTAMSFFNDEPMDSSDVSDVMALTSFVGFPSVLARLAYSLSKTEEAALAGQATNNSGYGGIFYKSPSEIYKDAEKYPYVPRGRPGYGPIEQFRAEPYTTPRSTTRPENDSVFNTAASQVPQVQRPASPPRQETVLPASRDVVPSFKENPQTLPGSLFDQR